MTSYVVHRLWAWWPLDGITIGKHIFLKNVQDKLIIEHELVHVRQMKEVGVVRYLFLYLLILPFGWNPWRLRWEAEAYAVQVKAGCNLSEIAKMMSGPQYLWPCRQKDAEAAIKRWL
jgi:hypothetical protein